MTDRLKGLYKSRPKNRFLRGSVLSLALFTLFTWSSGTITPGDFFTSRRLENLDRFLTHDIVPFPLREGGFELSALWSWAWEILSDRGLDAALSTLAISVLAIVLALLLSFVFAPLAAANLSTRRPFDATPGSDRLGWRALRHVGANVY